MHIAAMANWSHISADYYLNTFLLTLQLGAYSTTLYNVLNDTFQALIAFIVPISFKKERLERLHPFSRLNTYWTLIYTLYVNQAEGVLSV